MSPIIRGLYSEGLQTTVLPHMSGIATPRTERKYRNYKNTIIRNVRIKARTRQGYGSIPRNDGEPVDRRRNTPH